MKRVYLTLLATCLFISSCTKQNNIESPKQVEQIEVTPTVVIDRSYFGKYFARNADNDLLVVGSIDNQYLFTIFTEREPMPSWEFSSKEIDSFIEKSSNEYGFFEFILTKVENGFHFIYKKTPIPEGAIIMKEWTFVKED